MTARSVDRLASLECQVRRQRMLTFLALLVCSASMLVSAKSVPKSDREVAVLSVPSISYLAEPTDKWLAAMRTWHALMIEAKAFQGKYAAASADAFVQDVVQPDLVRQAAGELRQRKLLK